VAIGALRRCGFVKQHSLPGYNPRQIVTAATRHILVCALQREGRPRIVVKSSWLPTIDIVAAGAVRDLLPGSKLPRMRIVMAAGALHGGVAKIHVLQGSFQCRRPVAIRARYCSMGTEQRKLGLRMVESAEFFPLDRGVARFASRSPAVHALRRHLYSELARVRIVVACRAGAILKLEFHGND
jgi:hypothetical protein